MENSALITADLVQVRGKVQIKNTASIGTVATPVTQVKVGGGCRYPVVRLLCHALHGCSHRSTESCSPASVPDLAKPPLDLPTWYANAKPGPMSQTCTTGQLPGAVRQ